MDKVALQNVVSCWGKYDVLAPLEGGHRNAAFRVSGANGECVLKSTRRNEAAMNWLVDIHSIARDCGIVVPVLLKGQNGCFVQKGWTLEIFINGVHPDALPTDWLQSVMARFHSATRNVGQRPTFVSTNDLLHLRTGGDVDLDLMPADLVQALRKAWRAVSSSPQSVVHGNINVSNIVAIPNGDFAILDWDESRFDFSFCDIAQFSIESANAKALRAVQAYEIACSWQVEPEYAKQQAEAFLAE